MFDLLIDWFRVSLYLSAEYGPIFLALVAKEVSSFILGVVNWRAGRLAYE